MVVNAAESNVFCRLTNHESTELVEEHTTSKNHRKTKSVHFADTKGLALASILHFAKDNTESSSRRKIIAYLRDNNTRDPGTPARLLNFKSNVPYNEVRGHLTTRNVCLESAVCLTFGIYGRVYVRNLAFEKDVFVRYTFDAWQTFTDEYANYIPGASTGETDSFFFYIKPPETTENKKMEFAICYKVGETEYWDNNHGDDYRLVYFKTDTIDVTNELSNRNI